MTNLSKREKALLVACFLVVFIMGNFIAIRHVRKNFGVDPGQVGALKNELADLEMWLEDGPAAIAKEQWLRKHTPHENSMTKAQGDLLQFLQDDLFERKIKIDKQALQEPDSNDIYQEVAVSLTIRGAEKDIIEWLTTLQGAKKFQVIKRLELELDRRSQEEEPQAVCQIILARWFAPLGEDPYEEEPAPAVTEGVNRDNTPANQAVSG